MVGESEEWPRSPSLSTVSLARGMALPSELVLVTTSLATSLHDMTAGSTVLTFKQGSTQPIEVTDTASLRRSTTYVEARHGVGGLVLSLHGAGKGAVNVWSFAKVRLLLQDSFAACSRASAGVYDSALPSANSVDLHRLVKVGKLPRRRYRLRPSLSMGGAPWPSLKSVGL